MYNVIKCIYLCRFIILLNKIIKFATFLIVILAVLVSLYFMYKDEINVRICNVTIIESFSYCKSQNYDIAKSCTIIIERSAHSYQLINRNFSQRDQFNKLANQRIALNDLSTLVENSGLKYKKRNN